MLESKDNDILKILQIYQMLDQTPRTPPQEKNKYSTVIVGAILATILPLMIIIYNSGVQQENVLRKIDNNRLELKAEFTTEIANIRQLVSDSMSKSSSKEGDLFLKINKLEGSCEDLRTEYMTLKDRNESLTRSYNELYRDVQYLKSVNNVRQ